VSDTNSSFTHVIAALQELTRASYLTQQTLEKGIVVRTDTSSGATGARPVASTTGQPYFDITLGLPIWWNGTIWVNATGGAV
jgi:hypothetical protein